MSPLEFMQRLAALVPRPRLHLIRFHGVLAPNAKLRAKVVPQPLDELAQKVPLREGSEAEHDKARGRSMRLGWAKLLKRVFNLNLEHCPNCGGDLKVIAAILVSSDTKGPEDLLCPSSRQGLRALADPPSKRFSIILAWRRGHHRARPPVGRCRFKTSDSKAGPEP